MNSSANSIEDDNMSCDIRCSNVKSILPIMMTLVLLLVCCTGVNQSANETIREMGDVVPADSNNKITNNHQYEDNRLGKVDSIYIDISYYYKAQISINNSNEGVLNLSANGINHNESLPDEFCAYVFSSVDSIFVKKIYPVEKSREWTNRVIESEYPTISFHIYSDGKKYKRTVNFGPVNGPYNIKYSDAFLRMKHSLINK